MTADIKSNDLANTDHKNNGNVVHNPWRDLRQFTDARIGLGRAGISMRQQMVAQIWFGLNKLLEPIFDRVRRFMPDTRPLDLAPLVVFIAVIALRDIILPGILLR